MYTFRRRVNAQIRFKKAVVIQRALRKVLERNKLEFYRRNMDKIIVIQSCMRMFKAKQTRRRLLRIRIQQERTVKKFERNFMSLYNQKPSQKRKHKINKLLLDQQSVLLQERIFVGASALANPINKTGPYIHQAPGTATKAAHILGLGPA